MTDHSGTAAMIGSQPDQPRLHLLNKPPSHTRFAGCIGAMAPQDTLVLIEDGVIAAVTPGLALPAGTRVCHADLQARGLGGRPLGDSVTVADYAEIAALTVQHRRVVSW